MSKMTFKKETIKKFVADVNDKGNTAACFIDIASQNQFFVSDLGAVFLKGDEYVWNIDGVGRLIEKNGFLYIDED